MRFIFKKIISFIIRILNMDKNKSPKGFGVEGIDMFY